MTSILALAVLGSWTYAGFLADPAPASPTPPPAPASVQPIDLNPKVEPAANPEPEPEEESELEEELEPEPKLEQEPEASTVLPATVSSATPPTRYRLADASGQVWEHADPVYLQSFVEARNRSFVQQRYDQLLRARSAPCTTGHCR